jgi:hypothetical protein
MLPKKELVLFYCTFLALKARATLTVQISPSEYKLARERRLFQAYVFSYLVVTFPTNLVTNAKFVLSQIIDDGYKHSLIVYEDKQTHGMRLHAAVWEGELRQCPVWTAFSMSKMHHMLCASRIRRY